MYIGTLTRKGVSKTLEHRLSDDIPIELTKSVKSDEPTLVWVNQFKLNKFFHFGVWHSIKHQVFERIKLFVIYSVHIFDLKRIQVIPQNSFHFINRLFDIANVILDDKINKEFST